ncbi:MAG TPA: CopD family protein [Longimicrobiales bacterium]|nr:CopD family protein [Longimicrobiales bacterium]
MIARRAWGSALPASARRALVALALIGAAPGLLPGSPARAEPAPTAVDDATSLPLHTALDGSYPADGATVDGVREVRLRFTTPVQLSLSRVELVTRSGPFGAVGDLETVAGSGDRELRLPLAEPLPPGSYTVRWRTAGPDSHPISGSFAFRVGGRLAAAGGPGPRPVEATGTEGAAGTGSGPGGGPDQTTQARPDTDVAPGAAEAVPEGPTLPGIAVRWLFYVSIVLTVGCVAFRGLVLPQIVRDEQLSVAAPRTIRGTWILAWVGGVLGLLAVPARFWHQSVLLFGGEALGSTNLGDLLFRSVWGKAWFAEAGLAVLFLMGTAWAAPKGMRKRGWALMTLAAVAMCGVPAVSGHAWAAEELRTAAVASHGVHVLAAGVWMGSLAVLLFAGLPAYRTLGGRDALPGLLPGLVNAFSRIALVAVPLLVASGVLNAWIHLDRLGQLFSTAYGRTLVLKVGAALAAMALGFYNWRTVRPTLEQDPRAGLLRIPATLELLIGLGVLAVTALLISRGLPG